MKLELKHLAAYIPFELNTKYDLHDVVGGRHIFRDRLLTVDNIQFVLDYCKPILRPLSDLTKEIEVGGEMFEPEHFLNTELSKNFKVDYGIFSYYNGKIYFELDGDPYCRYDKNKYISFEVFRYVNDMLFEWHFDVFGLIEQGLAIDINTLKVNP